MKFNISNTYIKGKILHLCPNTLLIDWMKKIFVHIFLFLISFTFTYDTCAYFVEKISESLAVVPIDFESENDNAESGEQEEPNNQQARRNTVPSLLEDLLEDLHLHNLLSLHITTKLHLTFFLYPPFTTSDYTEIVFAPPDRVTV